MFVYVTFTIAPSGAGTFPPRPCLLGEGSRVASSNRRARSISNPSRSVATWRRVRRPGYCRGTNRSSGSRRWRFRRSASDRSRHDHAFRVEGGGAACPARRRWRKPSSPAAWRAGFKAAAVVPPEAFKSQRSARPRHRSRANGGGSTAIGSRSPDRDNAGEPDPSSPWPGGRARALAASASYLAPTISAALLSRASRDPRQPTTASRSAATVKLAGPVDLTYGRCLGPCATQLDGASAGGRQPTARSGPAA